MPNQGSIVLDRDHRWLDIEKLFKEPIVIAIYVNRKDADPRKLVPYQIEVV